MAGNTADALEPANSLDSLLSELKSESSVLPGEADLPGSVPPAESPCPEQPVAVSARPGDGDGGGPSERLAVPSPGPGTRIPYSSEAVEQTQGHAEAPAVSPLQAAQPRPEHGHDWRRDRQAVDNALIRSRVLIFAAGSLGMALALVVNELVFREMDPRSGLIEFLKTCNLLLSAGMLVLLVRHYRLVELMQRISMHLKALFPLDTDVDAMVSLRHTRFWIEVALCLPCLPPFCTFELVVANFENLLMYRAETLFCVYNSFRIYLIWPVVRDRFLTALPRRYTIASFTHTSMNSAFAFKCIMNGPMAILYVGFFWILSIFVAGYWYRAAEVSACLFNTTVSPECNQYAATHWVSGSDLIAKEKTNDLYLWNALWGVFITGTSVGYGDILATTHLGRCVMFISAMLGLVSVAAITASMSVVLMWNEHEQSAMLLIKREQARHNLTEMAVKLIQCFFRSRQRQNKSDSALRTRLLYKMWHCKQEFRMTKMACQVDMDDCMADTAKFQDVFHRTKFVFEAVQDIELKVRPADVTTAAQVEKMRGKLLEREPSFLFQKARSNIERKKTQKDKAQKNKQRLLSKTRAMQRIGQMRSAITANGFSKYLVAVARETATDSESGATPGESPTQGARSPVPRLSADWRRNRSAVDKRLVVAKCALAAVALIGTCSAIAQNEVLARGGHPQAAVVNLLKCINLICSFVILGILGRLYWLCIILARLQEHLKRGTIFVPVVPYSEIFSQVLFWVEVLLCCICVPPGITGELSLQTLDNIVVYRYENVGCLWNILARLYLLWHPLAAWMISDVPNRQNVAAVSNVKLDSLFVLKRMANSWLSAVYLAFTWLSSVVLFGYLFRCAEISACKFQYTVHPDCQLPSAQIWVVANNEFQKENDLYVWNAMWLAFVTMTTVGYGDQVPQTHGGRLVCAIATVAGLLLASLITAALTNLISFSPHEQAAISVIEREKARQRMRSCAAITLVLWWRRMKGRKLTARQSKIDKHALRREFLECQLETMREVEDLQSMGHKMDKVVRGMKKIEGKLEEIAEHLWTQEEVSANTKKWNLGATAILGEDVEDHSSNGMHEITE